jgi:glycerol transport system ATP-binding protein
VELILEGVGVQQDGESWLTDVNLRVGSGMTVLLGPSNAGKTTLMRVVAGLMQPDEGRILVGGEDVTRTSVRKRSVAFVYQQFINYPSLSVYENIASPLRRARDVPKDRIDARVHEVAELMGITDLLRRRPAELSGGQQQRTAIGRALARPVDVLLLDEPLANLDYKLREQLRADLKALFRDTGRVVLYATADPAEALSFAAPTVVLGEGRVRDVGDVVRLYEHPATLEVAASLSDPPLNVLPGLARDGRIECLGASFRVPGAQAEARPVTLGVRPHQVSLERGGPDDLEFPAEVRLAEVTGSATFLHLALDPAPGADAADPVRHLVVELAGTRRFPPGERATAFVDPAAVFLFDAATGRVLAESATEVDLRG